MNDKTIKFSAKFDTAEFDRSIEMMQRKLKEMYAPADMVRMQQQTAGRMEGTGTQMSKPTQEAYARATQQSRRELDQSLAKEVQMQDRISKILERRQATLKDLKRQQAEGLETVKEEETIKRRIAKMEENNFRLRENYRARDQAINQTMDARNSLNPQGLDRLSQAFKHGGLPGAATAGGRMLGAMGPMGMLGAGFGALGAIGGVAQVAGAGYANWTGMGANTASNSGSSMTGMLGREVGAAYKGNSALEMAFMPEKLKAMALAREAMKGQRVNNVIGALTSPLDGAMGAIGKGAMYGGALGSVVPGLGTMAGAAIGGVAGFGMNAFSNVANNPKNLSLLASPFSKTANANYESMMAKEFSQKYSQSLEGLKEQNPLKTAAAEDYSSNYMRYLGSQRSMGLDNAGFHGAGGFREQSINAGFTDSMGMEASGQILGAGGSTRMARNSVLGMQGARGFDLTNSNQVLGSLSSSLGSSETSKQAFIKMIAEGNKQGLDSSEYREESRKFMDATASAVAKSGVTSEASIDRIVSQMGGFLSEKSTRGVQAAGNAFQMFNQGMSQTGGPQGVMRASAFLQDSVIGKMDPMDRAGLSNIASDQLDENDPRIKFLADKYGTNAKDLVNRTLQASRKSLNTTARGDAAQNRGTELKKKLAALQGRPGTEQEQQSLQSQIELNEGEVGLTATFENKALGQDRKLSDAYSKGVTDPSMKGMLSEADIQAKLEGRATGRVEDESVAGAAEGSRMVLENFRKFKDDLVPAASAIRAFNDQLQRTIEIIQKMPEGDRAKYMGNLGLFDQPKNQTQSGKSK